jgi:hypothetical protein
MCYRKYNFALLFIKICCNQCVESAFIRLKTGCFSVRKTNLIFVIKFWLGEVYLWYFSFNFFRTWFDFPSFWTRIGGRIRLLGRSRVRIVWMRIRIRNNDQFYMFIIVTVLLFISIIFVNGGGGTLTTKFIVMVLSLESISFLCITTTGLKIWGHLWLEERS